MLTRKQLLFLKYLKSHEPLTYDELTQKYTKQKLAHTFDVLLHDGYITGDRPPIVPLYTSSGRPERYSVSDKGLIAIELLIDDKRSFFTRLFADKAADVIVSAAVAFITAVITYILMPRLFPFLTWK